MMSSKPDDIERAKEQAAVQQAEQYLQFSKAPVIKNFGDLSRGEIPEPLKYERPMEMTTT